MSDFERLWWVLSGCVSVPVQGDSSPFILPSFTEVVLTPLQEGVLQALAAVEKEVCMYNWPQEFVHILFAERDVSIYFYQYYGSSVRE